MAIKKRPISPRQKMINLMYLVLMAMLALNISTEVLNGFSIVEESLNRTTANSSAENAALYSNFADQMKQNPAKVKAWFEKATQVKEMSDSLYNFAQQLKEAIVREADGSDGDVLHIENKDNLEAAGIVMLAPGSGKGGKLYRAINSYRDRILMMVTDEHQKKIIQSNLSTRVPKDAKNLGKNWQEYMFENMPVAAAVTLLSKLQSDVRYAEGEVLHTLVSNIDMKDIRVNKLDAFVIPEKTTLYPGERFNANIVMAAVDTTQQPEIYVNGVRVNTAHGQYSFTAGGVGEHQFGGYILMHVVESLQIINTNTLLEVTSTLLDMTHECRDAASDIDHQVGQFHQTDHQVEEISIVCEVTVAHQSLVMQVGCENLCVLEDSTVLDDGFLVLCNFHHVVEALVQEIDLQVERPSFHVLVGVSEVRVVVHRFEVWLPIVTFTE